MTWIPFQDANGDRWAVNQEGMYLLVRAYVRSNSIRRRSRVTEVSNGFLMPTTYDFETDYNGFRGEIDNETTRWYFTAEQMVTRSGRVMRTNLLDLVATTRDNANTVERMRRSASERSAGNISSNVAGWEFALGAAQFVRDASATILVVTAGIATGGAAVAGAAGAAGGGTMLLGSGGAALATLGAGSVLRGVGTYQDGGTVGAAVVNATGTFVVGAIGISGSVAGVSGVADQRIMLAVGSGMSGAFQFTQSLAAGKDMKVAATQGLAAAGLGAFGNVVGARMETMSTVVRVTVGGAIDYASNKAVDALAPSPPTAQTPLPTTRPAVRGLVDFAGVPAAAGQDESYLDSMVLRRL